MKRFQKALFALAAVIALGWVGASTASAQVTFFVSSSGARQVRAEGRAEAVGVIAFTANSAGSIIGAAVPATGSQIILDFGAVVLSSGDSTPATVTGPVPCSGTVAFNGVINPAFILKTCVGNTVLLNFTATTAFVPGDILSISGVRVDANALGAGANVNATTSATVPAANQATNPVTLVVFSALTVATVQTAPSTTVALIPTASNILFCTVVAGVTTAVQIVNLTEKFSQVFLSAAQEGGLGVDGAGVAPGALRIRVAMTAVPVGVAVTIGFGPTSSPAPFAFTLPATLTFTSTPALQDRDFDVTITGSNTAAVETMSLTFTYVVPDITDLKFPKTETTGAMRITFRGTGTSATDPPAAPIFSSASASRQYDGPIVRTLACASYLLFPWVANTGDGFVDTGLAIANTTKDPPSIGTIPQTGDVTLYFWRSTGTNNPAPLKIATALPGGQTATYVLSALGSPFSGYVIAVCGFQMGHGIAAFLSGGSFNAYVGVSLFNPRIFVGLTTEIAGH